jgi:small GTP-binding protein
MFKLGIRVFDDKISRLPAKSTLLFISSPGIDPAPFGISTMSNVVKERSLAVYLVNNKTPASVRREAELLGHDLESYEDEGTFRLVDSYSGFSGMPSEERFLVQDPSDIGMVRQTMDGAVEEGSVVLLDSMSSYMDMHGDGLEDFLGLVGELKKKASVMVLFSTWGYEPECVKRIKSEFETVLSLRPVEEISIVRQLLFAEKIGSESFEGMAVPVKILRPGGVRVYFPKVLITGPHQSGKSTMVKAISNSAVSVDRMGTTVAMDHGYLDHKGFACDLYGTPGQELFDPILYYLAEEAVAVILVIDATAVESFKRARTMMQLTNALDVPLIVAANHYDKEGALPVEKIREQLHLPPNIPIVPTVASEKIGIPELLDALIEKLMGVALAEARKEEGGGLGEGTKDGGGSRTRKEDGEGVTGR